MTYACLVILTELDLDECSHLLCLALTFMGISSAGRLSPRHFRPHLHSKKLSNSAQSWLQ
jgi:hypothetical protein